MVQSECRSIPLDIKILTSCYSSVPKDLVPGSDMAGEILAIGEDVTGWKVGDRVCANFCSGHIYGATTTTIQNTALGGAVHGVLTQYRSFPANVRQISLDHREGAKPKFSVVGRHSRTSFL